MGVDIIEKSFEFMKQIEKLSLLVSLLHNKEIINLWEMEMLDEISDAKTIEHIEK